MAVVYNYFEPIPIPDPENPKFKIKFQKSKIQSKKSRICETCSKPKKIGKREKHR
jgi:hypothetical protein